MRKATILAVIAIAVLVLTIIPTPAAAAGTFTAILNNTSSGEIKARASGGAYCNVDAGTSQSWSRIYDSGSYVIWQQEIDFADYDNIKASLYTVLEAPGWFDHAYRSVKVYKGSTLKQSWTTDTNSAWSGTQTTDTFSIGSSGTWKFIVKVWGTDWGSETCSMTGEFRVVDT